MITYGVAIAVLAVMETGAAIAYFLVIRLRKPRRRMTDRRAA